MWLEIQRGIRPGSTPTQAPHAESESSVSIREEDKKNNNNLQLAVMESQLIEKHQSQTHFYLMTEDEKAFQTDLFLKRSQRRQAGVIEEA